jgi:hypothetical protein
VQATEGKHKPTDERTAPPGQFVSDQHQADCLRFLEQVKELAQRRHEAGLGRAR